MTVPDDLYAPLPTVDMRARLFIGAPVPPQIQPVFREALSQYPQYIEREIPPENWHVTIAWLGEVENHAQYVSRLTKPLPQTYVPTITLTHVGRGHARDQLWAYAHTTPMLTNMRQDLFRRLGKLRFPLPERQREFVPHITLAKLFKMAGGVGMADYVISASFIIRELHIYQSHLRPTGAEYTVEGTIPLAL